MIVRNLRISPNEYRKMENSETYEMMVEGTFHVGDLIGLLEFDYKIGYTGSARTSVVSEINHTLGRPTKQRLSVRFVDLFDEHPNAFLKLAK